jgi:purine-binding chemotaxis protein CheW
MAERSQYVTLGVGDSLFATPVKSVREILNVSPVARLPNAPEHFLGMIDVRGQGVPVFDLRLTLGMDAAPDNENTRIVVLSVSSGSDQTLLGLKSDRVFEVTVLDSEKLDPPPAVSGNWSNHCIEGIGRRNGQFVTVLDLEKLLGGTIGLVAEAA